MTTDKQAEWWMGFACKQCGAPLAIQRSNDASKSGQHSARGWRVTCTSCGVTEYYGPGSIVGVSIAAWIIYTVVSRKRRLNRPHDLGSVSDQWIAEYRAHQPPDRSR